MSNTQLTPSEITIYRDRGYLILKYRLSDERLGEMRACYDELLAANRDIQADFMLGPHLNQPGPSRLSLPWLPGRLTTHVPQQHRP